MRFSDHVILNDEETGSQVVKELAHLLPFFSVGEEIRYTINNIESKPVKIVGMDMSVNYDKATKQYVTETVYRTSDGMLIDEDEISTWYGDDDDEA